MLEDIELVCPTHENHKQLKILKRREKIKNEESYKHLNGESKNKKITNKRFRKLNYFATKQ